jgi:hypothetical protein
LIVRFSSGLATTVAYTVAIYCLGHAKTPDRAFGAVYMLQTVLISIDAIVLPTLVSHYGYLVGIASGAGWFVAALLAAQWLPADMHPMMASRTLQDSTADRNYALGIAALIGSFLLEVSVFAVWGFLERVGRGNGISDEHIGYALSIGVLGGIPGGLLPAAAGARFGRLKMVGLSTLLLVVSYGALVQRLGWLSYTAWITTLNFGWVMGIVYYMGLAARNDPNGRFTRMLPFMQISGTAVGPAFSALATREGQLWPIFLIGALAAATGASIVVGSRVATIRLRPSP